MRWSLRSRLSRGCCRSSGRPSASASVRRCSPSCSAFRCCKPGTPRRPPPVGGSRVRPRPVPRPARQRPRRRPPWRLRGRPLSRACSCWEPAFGWRSSPPGSSAFIRCSDARGRWWRRPGCSPWASSCRRGPVSSSRGRIACRRRSACAVPSSCCPRSSARWTGSSKAPSRCTSSSMPDAATGSSCCSKSC